MHCSSTPLLEIEVLTEDEEEAAKAWDEGAGGRLWRSWWGRLREWRRLRQTWWFTSRLEAAMQGKAMAVCMSRDVCVQLYGQIVKLRSDWHDPEPHKGAIKIVMTGQRRTRKPSARMSTAGR